MVKQTNIKLIAETDLVRYIEDWFDGIINASVTVSIDYSAGENGVIEFESAIVTSESNESLTEEQIQEANKILENGREEEYVKMLSEYYIFSGVKFNANHYVI